MIISISDIENSNNVIQLFKSLLELQRIGSGSPIQNIQPKHSLVESLETKALQDIGTRAAAANLTI